MKKYLILLAMLITFASCNEEEVSQAQKRGYWDAKVIEFEDCEYIMFDAGYSAWGGHKGNCKNPIHE